MPDSSQGSTVSFAGAAIGQLVGWRVSPGQAAVEDFTGFGCDILGTGADARVVKRMDATAVDPGTAEVRLLGVPPYVATEIGKKGSLYFSYDGGGFTLQAILLSFDIEGAVGEFIKGSATFQLTGY
jgi:hypothetical protein